MMRSVSLGRAMMLFVCAGCLLVTVAAEAQRAGRDPGNSAKPRVPTTTSELATDGGSDDGVVAGTNEGGVAGAGIDELTSVRVASGLAFPTCAAAAPGDANHLYFIQKAGLVRSLHLISGTITNILTVPGVVGATSLNDERGLLGITFDQDYPTQPYFYVNFTGSDAGQLTTFVKRFTVTNTASDPIVVDVNSAITIIQYFQPFSNHNGGWLSFGPNDGYLYISAGDGGDQCDPNQRAQNTSDVHGKLMRLDVSGDAFPADVTRNYIIPPSNPFGNEIWAYGLRNPWRPGFDSMTGDLFIADVGQFIWEEINFQPASSTGGENYGWDCIEGFACSNTTGCSGTAGCNCATVGSVDPIGAYNHSGAGNINLLGSGCSITGGLVYRGNAIPSLQGTYFYSDFCGNFIDSFTYNGTTISNLKNRTSELAVAGFQIDNVVSFAEDNNRELYIIDQGSGSNGEIYKIVPALGACCFEDGSCGGGVSQNDCANSGGNWLGKNTLCANCPQPTGACCLSESNCVNATAAACASQSGIFHGVDTTCAEISCATPVGACCLENGQCLDGLTAAQCAQVANATYHGDGSLCIDVSCGLEPTGACCLTNGSCVGASTSEDCATQGGTYQGDDSDCAGANCPQPCLADIVDSGTFQPPPDGIVDGADLAYLLGEWGPNPGSLADIVDTNTFQPPPDGLVDGADLAYLLGAWGNCP